MASQKAVFKSFPVGGVALARFALCSTPAAAVVSTGAAIECFGIVQNGAAASSQAIFATSGVTKAIASAAIVKGALLMPAAAGKVVTHDGVGTSVHVGTALEAAGADGDVIEIQLNPLKVLAQA